MPGREKCFMLWQWVWSKGSKRGLPGGSIGLRMGDNAKCFHLSGDKLAKVGQSLWMAMNSQARTLGLIRKCPSRAGPLEGPSGGRIDRVWMGKPGSSGTT